MSLLSTLKVSGDIVENVKSTEDQYKQLHKTIKELLEEVIETAEKEQGKNSRLKCGKTKEKKFIGPVFG